MDAAVALQRKKTIKILSTVDFSLSKQGIFFVTLRQNEIPARVSRFLFCIIFTEGSLVDSNSPGPASHVPRGKNSPVDCF